jgi:hypothetical protein
VSLIIVIFYFDKGQNKSAFKLFVSGVFIIPLLIFIYVAISTGLISTKNAGGECFLGSKIWLMTDCIIFLFLIPEFLLNTFYLNKKLKRTVSNPVLWGLNDTTRKLADVEKEMPQATPDVKQNFMIEVNQEGGQNSEDDNDAIKYHGNDDHV